jgi:hypothetical protein
VKIGPNDESAECRKFDIALISGGMMGDQHCRIITDPKYIGVNMIGRLYKSSFTRNNGQTG